MNRKARRAAKAGSTITASLPQIRTLLNEALGKLRQNDPAAAQLSAQAALKIDPQSSEAHYLLANAFLFQKRMGEAGKAFRQAIRINPNLPEAHNNLGTILEQGGEIEAALECYRRALALRPDYAEAHNNLGNVQKAHGLVADSIVSFRAAITARPGYAEAWYNLGNTLGPEQAEEAINAYRQASALRPGFVEALNNLSALLVALGRPAEAETASRQAISTAGRIPESHYNLGAALRDLGKSQEAIAAFRQAITLRPAYADAHIAIGNILQGQGRQTEAFELFRHAQQLQPLAKWPAAKAKPDFSVLLLISPGAANTPIQYLVGRSNYDSYILGIMPGADYDPALLRSKADVVVNLISDVDRGGDILPTATELIERIGKPVLNHPAKIRTTSRDAVAARIEHIPHCRVPRTVRLSAASLSDDREAGHLPIPLLVRPIGVHGGDAFEKLEDHAELSAFVSRYPSRAYYAAEYIDFRSADGYFRKYRLIFIDGQIYPYHLAIADQWKVHYFRTDMADHEWMQREEQAFLDSPSRIFGANGMAALHTIQAEIGLDYFGIDCSLDREGDMVVFEVNATMLVHGETTTFGYKQSYITRIKQAFDSMLARAAEKPAA